MFSGKRAAKLGAIAAVFVFAALALVAQTRIDDQPRPITRDTPAVVPPQPERMPGVVVAAESAAPTAPAEAPWYAKILVGMADKLWEGLAALVLALLGYFQRLRFKSELVTKAKDAVVDYVRRAVLAVKQEMGDAIKKAAADGKLTKKEAQALKTLFWDKFWGQIAGDSWLAGALKSLKWGKNHVERLAETEAEAFLNSVNSGN